MQAFPYNYADLKSFWLFPGVLRSWKDFRIESAQTAQDLHPEFARMALDNSQYHGLTSSVLAIKELGVWSVEYGHWWKRVRLLNDTTIEIIFKALLQIEEVGRTYWSSKTGFAPALGYLGLVRPRYQIGLRFMDDSIRWLVFGSPGLYGAEYALVFNSANQDSNSNPHPMHEPLALGNTALLWAVLDAISGE